MRFTFIVEVDVERVEGKFAGREEIAEQIIEAIEGADPGSYDGDNGGQYETTAWEVTEQPQPAKKGKGKNLQVVDKRDGKVFDVPPRRSWPITSGFLRGRGR